MAIEERHACRRNKLRAGDVYKTHQQSRSFLKFDAQKLKVQRVQRVTSGGHAILGTYLGTERKVRGAKVSSKSESRKLPVYNVESDGDIAAFRVFEQRIRTQVGMGEQQLNDAIA